MAGRWLDATQAAQELGISTDAVRKRIARGSLASERDAAGHVRVWLDFSESDQPEWTDAAGRDNFAHAPETGQRDELVEQLRSEVDYLRQRLEDAETRDRESRRLLAAALERIPELESGETQHRTSPTGENVESTGAYEAPVEPETGHEEPAGSGEGESYSRGWLERIRAVWKR